MNLSVQDLAAIVIAAALVLIMLFGIDITQG
jgi:hypothetical protein